MIPLYEDPWYTFHFDEDRSVQRFHLAGSTAGKSIRVYETDSKSRQRKGLITSAIVGEDGWVELAAPLIVRAGEGFIVEFES